MKHAVVFDNCVNKWDNALPLGNGVFGCMVYYEDGILNMPMNHYEVYYNIKDAVLPEDIEKIPFEGVAGELHKQQYEKAVRNQAKDGEAFCHYRPNCERGKDPGEFVSKFDNAYPSTGDLRFTFSDKLDDAKSKLALYTEKARVEFDLKKDKNELSMQTITAREDCIINKVKQSKSGLLKSVKIDFLPYRSFDMPDIEYKQIDETTFVYRVVRMLPPSKTRSFEFCGVIRLAGAKGKLEVYENGAEIVLTESGNEVNIITGIFTQWVYKDIIGEGISRIDDFEARLPEIEKEHKAYWRAFFERSSIDIPDEFLEQVYYINQYALDCCSGKDGIMKHHACGLNGLWDVKHPSLWGSMWYWDVNIQAAFAGVFSSNRLDLAKVFSDGLLTYVNLAEQYAKNNHCMSGIAADYPYFNYYSTWPWCAQYLWFLYEYSMDKDYLKNDAYPVFIRIAEFLLDLFEYDEKTDTYNVYPDISPEQGPLTHNSTITISTAKYLFKFTLEAAEIIGDNSPLLPKVKEVMEKLPPYALSGLSEYGVHLKDSPDAPDNLWIRHPSMLMPVFPIGEFGLDSDEETRKIVSNTIDFLEERNEIGIFPGSWIAAAAARIGRGQTAIRLLYEKGIDHMVRSNGLSAEETDHFINFCLVCRQPLYYPCMMEFTGEMLAAVNEMLLQSVNNIIRVFPAIPDGDPEYYRMMRHGYSITEYTRRYSNYDAWENARFDKLLAKGAFEISASLKNRKIEWILVKSNKGGKVHLTSPFMDRDISVYCGNEKISASFEGELLCFDTEEGKSYLVAYSADAYTEKTTDEEYNSGIMSHEAYTKRSVTIGEDSETNYKKSLDYFLRSWYIGNVRADNHTVYKFDFGSVYDKEYKGCMTAHTFASEEMMVAMCKFEFVGDRDLDFAWKRGYGFADGSGITAVDRGKPDVLRRDFVEGENEVEFVIEVPRGQYEFLVVSGDSEEDSVTIVEGVNGRRAGGDVVKKGTYQCKVIPVVQEKDEPVRIKLSTKPGYKWKLNNIYMNAIKGY